MAGHVGLELGNVVFKFAIEISAEPVGFLEHFRTRDFSRESCEASQRCGVGDMQLRGLMPRMSVTCPDFKPAPLVWHSRRKGSLWSFSPSDFIEVP